MATYTYDPSNIGVAGLDRMRFELGDVNVSDNGIHAAISDEEINAMITLYPSDWKRAKYKIVESIYRRFSYEVTTSTAGVSIQLQARVEHWKQVYSEFKKEAAGATAPSIDSLSTIDSPTGDGGHYFKFGMMDNPPVDELGG